MPKRSAGLLLYRRRPEIEVLLVHPGGPFWARRDEGAWSIPKGEFDDEPAEAAARREFEEETGFRLDAVLADPNAAFLGLGTTRQKAGKEVAAFAAEGDLDPARLDSNRFEIEWPPGSGRRQSFPEVDRAAWFAPAGARRLILPAQAVFLDRLEALLGA